MTVLRPSLPPVISMTTRMLSLPTSAARAVLAMKLGTTELRANSDEPCSVRARNERRVNMGVPLELMSQMFTTEAQRTQREDKKTKDQKQSRYHPADQRGSFQLVFLSSGLLVFPLCSL